MPMDGDLWSVLNFLC